MALIDHKDHLRQIDEHLGYDKETKGKTVTPANNPYIDQIKEYLKDKDVEIVVKKGMMSIIDKDHTLEYPHYRKDVRDLSMLDVYGVCRLFNVNDPSGSIHHVIKKLLASGTRGAKGINKDRLEALVTLISYLEDEGIIDYEGSFMEGKISYQIRPEYLNEVKVDKINQRN